MAERRPEAVAKARSRPASISGSTADIEPNITCTSLPKIPATEGPVLLALDLMAANQPAAEALVRRYMEGTPLPELRMAYARVLMQAQRLGDAVSELGEVTRQQPDNAPPWLMLGALHVELRHPREAEQAL